MDDRPPAHWNSRTPRKMDGSGDVSKRLWLYPRGVGLSDPPSDSIGRPCSLEEKTSADHRCLLNLLRHVDERRAQEWANILIGEFGSLAATIAADRQRSRVLDDPEANSLLDAVQQALTASLRFEALSGPILSNSQNLIDYLKSRMAYLPAERLLILFLGSGNRLLSDELISYGTIDELPCYPREIVKRALEVNATSLILVHNHPSGDPTPSKGDLAGTQSVANAAQTLGIRLHDHIIVARSGWLSMRAEGLL
jgi:DNA repair protein RadC